MHVNYYVLDFRYKIYACAIKRERENSNIISRKYSYLNFKKKLTIYNQ